MYITNHLEGIFVKEFCFSISTIFVILIIFLTYNEHRGRFRFSKFLGLYATYLINYIIVLPYCLLPLIKRDESNNAFFNLFYNNYSDFFAVLIIPLCNMVTRFLLNKVFDIDISDEDDKKYKNVMYGLLYFILVISLITFEVDSVLFVALFLIGTHVDFSIKKPVTSILSKDIQQRMRVCIISIISFFLLSVFENTFNCSYYLILPWIITYILCIICLIIIIIHKKMKKHNVK